MGRGRIQRIEGLEALFGAFGESIVSCDLLPIGAPRRNWKATLVSDGMVFLCHPDLDTLEDIADQFANRLQLYAG